MQLALRGAWARGSPFSTIRFALTLFAPAALASCGDNFTAAEAPARAGTGGASGEGGESGTTNGDSGGKGGVGASGGRGGGGTGGTKSKGGEAGNGAAGNGGEAGTGVVPPPVCDPAALADGCVPADDAIYVSTNGDNDNDGTATAPLATIGAAVTKAASSGAPIFVCGGSYNEHVVVADDDIEIHGGFACPTGGNPWLYDSTKRAHIAPSTTGYALHVTNVSGLTVTDLELESANAEMPGESSIAVFVSRSEDVAFERVGITAGDGVKGEDGVREGSNHTQDQLGGNGAVGDSGGAVAMCTCADGSISLGGIGGVGGPTPTAGAAGSPDEGGGQPGTPGSCGTVGTGQDGGSPTASSDGTGAASLGALTTSGWTATSGQPGANGTPGQGGGGGAGALGVGNGGGGGGACGGCGGKGGGDGAGGGASIGIAALRSDVSLVAVSIATGDAGDGGRGMEGEAGQNGGVHGNSTGLACDGGNGGTGADGAAGGGGAGGISVGILHSADSTVTVSPTTTFDIGMPGAGGPAAMGSNNAGIAGVNDDILEAS